MIHSIIIHHEQFFSLPLLCGYIYIYILFIFIFCSLFIVHAKRKFSSLTYFAFYFYLPTLHRYQLLANSQTQTCTAIFPIYRTIFLIKIIENRLLHTFFNTLAGVFYYKGQHTRCFVLML